MKMNKSRLPEKWCIKGCEELGQWQEITMNNKCTHGLNHPSTYYFVESNDLLNWDSFSSYMPSGYTLITFDQFKEHFIDKKMTIQESIIDLKKQIADLESKLNNNPPDITVNGYKGEFLDDYIKFGCAHINKELLISLKELINDYRNYHLGEQLPNITSKSITKVTIGIGEFSSKEIDEIATYYIKKDELKNT